MSWLGETIPAGMINLEIGDVVQANREPYIVTMVNSCRARIEPLKRKHFSGQTCFGQKIEFDAPGRALNISPNAEPGDILERRGRKGAATFLHARAQRSKNKANRANNNNTKEQDQMKKSKTEVKDKTKMRGGLAAEKAQDEAKAPNQIAAAKAGIKTCGTLGEVMGFAATAVMRRLGKEGCTPAHVEAILRAQGVKPSPATCSIQTNAGKKGERGEPAPLTKEQVAELIKSAPEPKAEPKAPKGKKAPATETK